MANYKLRIFLFFQFFHRIKKQSVNLNHFWFILNVGFLFLFFWWLWCIRPRRRFDLLNASSHISLFLFHLELPLIISYFLVDGLIHCVSLCSLPIDKSFSFVNQIIPHLVRSKEKRTRKHFQESSISAIHFVCGIAFLLYDVPSWSDILNNDLIYHLFIWVVGVRIKVIGLHKTNFKFFLAKFENITRRILIKALVIVR